MSVQRAYKTASKNRHAIQAFGSNPKKESVRRLTLFVYPSTDQRRSWNKLLQVYMVIAPRVHKHSKNQAVTLKFYISEGMVALCLLIL